MQNIGQGTCGILKLRPDMLDMPQLQMLHLDEINIGVGNFCRRHK